MTDIGEEVRLTTSIAIDGTPTNPGGIAITVTSPAGLASTPTPTNVSAGVYRAAVTPDAAGRWRYTWTTTSPNGVDHGYFDVRGNPPPPGRLDLLATIDDLENRFQGALTADQVRVAPELLRDASAKIRAYTRQTFDHVVDDVATLRPIGTKLTLPQRPVLAVSSVVAISGYDGVPDVTLSGWQFDGIDTIDVYGLSSVILNLPEWWSDLNGGPGTYRVTYDHGYATTPDDIVAKACELVTRVLTSPSQAEGMGSERAGPFGYSMAPGAGSAGASVRLTKADRDDLAEAGYRRTTGTVQLRV
jgi:hypothetical protein